MENDITGIMLWDKMFKVGQYADDTFLLLDGTEKSLNSSCLMPYVIRYAS